ncbi:MAG TPA: MarR family transcriptional regulator [Gemmatimonadaceae bacterium]|nr:MarR family transcriptional regulator [Gemmatimonadaceae bacterium]
MNDMVESERAVKTKGHWTFAMLHAAQVVSDELETALGRVGLSMAKHSALSELARSKAPLTLSELAAKLSCVRSNITQLVDRLEADGLVRRVADAGDRRSVRAELTDLGKEKQLAGAREIERTQQTLSERLSETEKAALEGSLGAFG